MPVSSIGTPGDKVHEFSADLIVHRRYTEAECVVALDLVDPEGEDLRGW